MNPIANPPLRDRERAALAFIQTSWDTRGYAPAMRELAAHLHTSTSVASYNITTLERRNLLHIPRAETGEIVAHTMRLTATAQALLKASPAHGKGIE